MYKYYIIIAILCITAICTTELSAKPGEVKDDYYPMCLTAPMVVRVIEKGKVVYFAGTSNSGWLFGDRQKIEKDANMYDVSSSVFNDAMLSESNLIIDYECK